MKSPLRSMSNAELRKAARKYEAPNPFTAEINRRVSKRLSRRSTKRH